MSKSRITAEFTSEIYTLFTQLVAKESGLYFDDTKEAAMRIVLDERLNALDLKDYRSYYNFLAGNDHSATEQNEERNPVRELQRLLDSLVVNETTFFRNHEHFEAIRSEILPRLIKRNQTSRILRFWSAGCSLGQEPYSLAIAAIETLEALGEKVGGATGWKIEIVATDISEKALKAARAGRYRADDVRNLDVKQLERFFVSPIKADAPTAPLHPSQLLTPNRISAARLHDRTQYEVGSQLRQLVQFSYLNLVREIYPRDKFRNFDLILCENVTIYFPSDVTRHVIENIYEALNEGGWLFIGYSETLWQVSDRFKLINSNDTFYYQKPFPNEVVPQIYTRSRSVTGPLSLNRQRLTQNLNGNPDSKLDKNSTDQLKKPPNPHLLDFEVTGGLKKPAPLPAPTIRPNPALYVLRDREMAKLVPPAPIVSDVPIQSQVKNGWEEALEQGLRMIQEHDFESAGLYLEQANTLQPDNVQILGAMAQLKAKLGDYDSALQLSQQAIRLDSLCEDAHLMLAMIYHRENRVQEAIEEFERTIYINFDSVVAHMRLGDIFRGRGQNTGALREYRNAVKALAKKSPDEIIEDLPAELLKRTCEQNITRLNHR